MILEPGESEPTTPLEVAALMRSRARGYRAISWAAAADLLDLGAGVIEGLQSHLSARAPCRPPKEPEPLTMASIERQVLGIQPADSEPRLTPVSRAERDAIERAARPKPSHPF